MSRGRAKRRDIHGLADPSLMTDEQLLSSRTVAGCPMRDGCTTMFVRLIVGHCGCGRCGCCSACTTCCGSAWARRTRRRLSSPRRRSPSRTSSGWSSVDGRRRGRTGRAERPLGSTGPAQRAVVAVDPATKSHENADMTAFTAAGRGVPVETMLGASSEGGTNDRLDGVTDSNGQEQQVSFTWTWLGKTLTREKAQGERAVMKQLLTALGFEYPKAPTGFVKLQREAEHAALSEVQRRHAWMLGPRPGEPSLDLQGQGAARDLDTLECQAIKSF